MQSIINVNGLTQPNYLVVGMDLGIFDFSITSMEEILGELDLDILRTARRKGVSILPVLTNLSEGKFSAELARTILSNTDSLNNLITPVMQILNS